MNSPAVADVTQHLARSFGVAIRRAKAPEAVGREGVSTVSSMASGSFGSASNSQEGVSVSLGDTGYFGVSTKRTLKRRPKQPPIGETSSPIEPHPALDVRQCFFNKKPYEMVHGIVAFLEQWCGCCRCVQDRTDSCSCEREAPDCTAPHLELFLPSPASDSSSSCTCYACVSHRMIKDTQYLGWPLAEEIDSKLTTVAFAPHTTGSEGSCPRRAQRRAVVLRQLMEVVKTLHEKEPEFGALFPTTLLTVIADRGSSLQVRLNAAVVIGSMFASGLYAFKESAPTTLLNIFTRTLGGVSANFSIALAIGFCLQVSGAAATSSEANALRRLLHPKQPPQPKPKMSTNSKGELSLLASVPSGGEDMSAGEGTTGSTTTPTGACEDRFSCLKSSGVSTSLQGVSSSGGARRSSPNKGSSHTKWGVQRNIGKELSESVRDERTSRTVYISRMDPLISVSTLREFLVGCGQLYRVRLCGDDCSRSRFGFVEFEAKQQAKQLLGHSGSILGNELISCQAARRPIQDYDPRDAIFDSRRGMVRACLFGLNVPQEQLDQTRLERSSALSRSQAAAKTKGMPPASPFRTGGKKENTGTLSEGGGARMAEGEEEG